jgi:succinate--hydroxymethylglutarate CoA-transferase
LNGLRVLDVTRILAGPFCTQIFADYGADVVKVEQRGVGDDTRHWKVKGEAASWKTDTPISYYFASVNRNKRSITLDLKKQAGLDILYELARTSDIFVENFIPGKAQELGFGYEKLKEINPKIIYASISGYGAGGPYSSRAGYDAIAAAEGGLMHITGEAGRAPVRPGLGMVGACRQMIYSSGLATLQSCSKPRPHSQGPTDGIGTEDDCGSSQLRLEFLQAHQILPLSL